MPWFNVDDSFHSHPKALATEPAALGLWVVAGSWSSANLTEGFVPDHVLPRLLPDSAMLAEALVATGLWKRQRGGYKFHDWTDWNATRKAVRARRAANARRQALFRDPGLKQAIQDRDGDSCRYCGTAVRWGSGRAPDSATYDHVDPGGENTLENLVVACAACNSKKGMRTAAQAGMPLLPPQGTGNASRNASDASRNASGTPVDSEPGSPGETQAKPPAPAPTSGKPVMRNGTRNASRNASTNASVQASQSNPIHQSVVDLVNRVAGRYAHVLDDDVILKSIIDSIHGRTGVVVPAEHAKVIAASILDGRTTTDPAAYVRAAIRRESDPAGRFLPVAQIPAGDRAGWCGDCNPQTRLTGEDEPRRCPNCHPLREVS